MVLAKAQKDGKVGMINISGKEILPAEYEEINAIEKIENAYNVDIAFFSSLGLSGDGIISDTDIEQTMIRKIIMSHSKKNIFLFEKCKVNKIYAYTVCHKTDVDEVIVSI